MADSLARLPKAELHVHLEGSLEPSTLRELEPGLDAKEIERRYRYRDFAGFIDSFKWVTGLLREPADYALATRRLLERLDAENVRYAEITLSAGTMLWRGQDFFAIYDSVAPAAEGSPVAVRWIVDAIRHFGPEHAMEVAKLAVKRAGQGVIAFGIGGDETRGPAEWFTDVFRFVKDHGLHVTAHAGETIGAASVRAAIEAGAERIGHGILAAEDPVLLKELRKRDIPLEVCISSNVATGAVKRLEEHPIRRIFDTGVPIILNTDDPAMFHTTLVGEYELAASKFGFSEGELREIAENGFRYGFGCHTGTGDRTSRPSP